MITLSSLQSIRRPAPTKDTLTQKKEEVKASLREYAMKDASIKKLMEDLKNAKPIPALSFSKGEGPEMNDKLFLIPQADIEELVTTNSIAISDPDRLEILLIEDMEEEFVERNSMADNRFTYEMDYVPCHLWEYDIKPEEKSSSAQEFPSPKTTPSGKSGIAYLIKGDQRELVELTPAFLEKYRVKAARSKKK